MGPKFETPSIHKKSFNCPRCGAFADQTWYEVSASQIWRDKDSDNLPYCVIPERLAELRIEDAAEYDKSKKIPPSIFKSWDRQVTGDVYIEDEEDKVYARRVTNLHLSRCRSCRDWSLWKHREVIYPNWSFEVEPNADMEESIKADFNEARQVLSISARSSAALLRLCIQKLCVQLGLPGKDLNKDIAELVKRGIDTKIQKSLDIVRVIGNESVHPGTIDLRDNRETAEKLFRLVNLIAFEMITHPKELDLLYGELPENKRKAIEERDKTTE